MKAYIGVTPLHKECQEIALCHPKKVGYMWESFPVLQAVPPLLSNSICDSSTRICRSSVGPSYSQAVHTIQDMVPNCGKIIIAFQCFSLTSKIKRQ